MGLWGFLTGNDSFSDGNRAGEEWFNQGGGIDVSDSTIYGIANDSGTSDYAEFHEGFSFEVDRQERLAANREKGGIIGWLFGG